MQIHFHPCLKSIEIVGPQRRISNVTNVDHLDRNQLLLFLFSHFIMRRKGDVWAVGSFSSI